MLCKWSRKEKEVVKDGGGWGWRISLQKGFFQKESLCCWGRVCSWASPGETQNVLFVLTIRRKEGRERELERGHAY